MDTEPLIHQARQLGEQIHRHPRAAAFRAAQDAAQRDGDALRLMQDLQKHSEHLHELEAARRPIEVADKRRMADLQRQVSGNDVLKALMRAQADFMELMHQVNAAIDEPLAVPDKQAS